MEGLINWFCKNPVAANFLMVPILVIGLMTWPTIKKEIFPETKIDLVLIKIPFPNATPEEVEKGVIVPIEEAIQDLEGIRTIRSTASQSIGSVVVETENGVDVRGMMSDLKTRIDSITNLAEQAEEPLLEQLVLKSPVLSLALSGTTSETALREVAEKIRTDLLSYDGGGTKITQIEIAGTRDYEISIEVSENVLERYALSFDQIANAVRRSSLDLPGGSVRTTSGEVLIRTEARRYTAEEFAEITVVTLPDGSIVKLGQIAFIRDEFEEADIATNFDGKPALVINIMRVGNEDTLKIADTAKKFVKEEADKRLPPGVKLEVWRDDSILLQGRLDLLMENGLFGLVLVTVVLALFLRPALAFLVALGIPIAFCGAVITMPYTGVSINMISLFAFILVLGIVVDDATVIGENVYRRIRLGEDPKIAAALGAHEVGVVVIFGVLTTVVAFLPMIGLSGVSGKIWPNIPLIVIPTLLVSLVQSKLVLPAHLAMLKPFVENASPSFIVRFQEFFAHGLEKFVDKFYRPILAGALNYRWVVTTGFFCILLLSISYVKNGHIKFIFLPQLEGNLILARLQMAEGVPFESTERAVAALNAGAFKLGEKYKDRDGNPIIKNVLSSSGTQPFVSIGMGALGSAPLGSNLGEVSIELQDAKNRDHTTNELTSAWRELTGPIPGAVVLSFRADVATSSSAIDLELTGADKEEISKATVAMKEALSRVAGVIDISDNDKEGKRELKLEILPQAEALGLRLQDIARQVRQGFFGEEIQRLQRGKDEVIVYVRYPRDERKSIADLQKSKIRTATGAEVPFSQVATASFGRAATALQRSDGQPAIRITADVDKAKGANANEVVAALNQGLESYNQKWIQNFFDWFSSKMGQEIQKREDGAIKQVMDQFPGVKIVFQGEQKDQNAALSELLSHALIALMGMYILMAIPLKSYVQPTIIMTAIPFGLIGAIFGHIVMGYDISIMSLCGSIALAGVVVNDSLVLVDYVNREIENGADIITAAWESGAARFRPILLTSLTTFAGLTPMLLETDLQAQILIPMAISLSFGILFATVITLFLVPCIYLILNDSKIVIKQIFS